MVVRVKLLVVLVFPIAMRRLGLRTCPLHVELSCVFRADRAKGKQALQVFTTALRTGGDVAFPDQLLERMSTIPTGIFIDRHSGVSIPRQQGIIGTKTFPELYLRAASES